MSNAQENWRKKVEKEIAKKPERKDKFLLDSGMEIERLYFPVSPNDEYETKQGFPGEYPYTRGVYPNMYHGQLSTIYHAHSSKQNQLPASFDVTHKARLTCLLAHIGLVI
ncbi:MAG: methylmalonyl-CoA mutase family protein, partial [bacterium]|nr:methylmalonyl-CoA mutase family protein [bacterium]